LLATPCRPIAHERPGIRLSTAQQATSPLCSCAPAANVLRIYASRHPLGYRVELVFEFQPDIFVVPVLHNHTRSLFFTCHAHIKFFWAYLVSILHRTVFLYLNALVKEKIKNPNVYIYHQHERDRHHPGMGGFSSYFLRILIVIVVDILIYV
jgi:hypothetical protein